MLVEISTRLVEISMKWSVLLDGANFLVDHFDL